MMNQKHVEAKLQLATAFAELAGQTPPERITISMIVDRLGKHRKTFYYHFSGKEQLIIWLFRYELGCALSERFEENLLVYEPEGSSCYADFPYYVHNLKESGRIYHAPFFSVLASVLEKRRTYYRAILSTRGPATLDQYLHRLYYPAIKQDIEFLVQRELKSLDRFRRQASRRSYRRTTVWTSSRNSTPMRSSPASPNGCTTHREEEARTTSTPSRTSSTIR